MATTDLTLTVADEVPVPCPACPPDAAPLLVPLHLVVMPVTEPGAVVLSAALDAEAFTPLREEHVRAHHPELLAAGGNGATVARATIPGAPDDSASAVAPPATGSTLTGL